MSYRNKTSLFFRSHRRERQTSDLSGGRRETERRQRPLVRPAARVCACVRLWGCRPQRPVSLRPCIYFRVWGVQCTKMVHSSYEYERTEDPASSNYERTRIKAFLKHKRLFLNGREPNISRGHCHKRQYKNIHVTITPRVFFILFILFFYLIVIGKLSGIRIHLATLKYCLTFILLCLAKALRFMRLRMKSFYYFSFSYRLTEIISTQVPSACTC